MKKYMVSKKATGVRRRQNFSRDLLTFAGQRIAQWAGRQFKARAALKQAARRRVKPSQKKSIAVGKIYNEGTGGQYSYFTGPSGKCYLPPHVENALAPQVLQTNNASQLKSTVGVQNVSVPLTLCSPSIATTYTGDKISRVVYDNSRGDVTINNIYLSNCYVIIYDIMCRKDVGTSSLQNPLYAWSQGDVDEGRASAYTYLGSTPWQSEVFNQFYKVCQVTNIVLGAGATHVHKVKLTPKKVVSAAYAQYSPYGIKDLTYYCMIEIHGSPANDSTTQTSVSIGVGGLNIINDTEECLKQIQKQTPTISVSNNLAASFAVGEQVINIGGSTITAQAEG